MGMIYGYGRCSTDKQSLTEDAQRLKVEQHIAINLSDHTYAGWLYDAAVSGSKPLFERPEGMKLWVLAQPGDHIVWAKLDRAFRSVVDGASTLQMLHAKGIYVHSLDLGLDTSTPTGRFISTVLLAFAELERHCIGDRTKEGLAAKRRMGRPAGAHTPIGWRKVGKGKHSFYLPDDREREQVRHIVALRKQGHSLASVTYEMRNTPRPSGYLWNRNSVIRATRAHDAGFPKKLGRELEQPSASA